MNAPRRVFLDTNVYILGASDPASTEALILRWVGWGQATLSPVEVIVSEELIQQIGRVARRLQGKDWAGELLGRIWQSLNVRYVLLSNADFAKLEALNVVPREDVGVYLTAQAGQADCFISANYKLIGALVATTGEFECLTPEAFKNKYLPSS